MSSFDGFPEDFFAFFDELAANNNRPWFNDNKPRYYESVVNPMCAFIVAVAPRLREISPHFIADPRPHGGSMFRIYRDTRFAKDKPPYKTHAACQFRHSAGKDAHAPGFYAHFEAAGLRFGGGIWKPATRQLTVIREYIQDNPAEWQRLRDDDAMQKHGGIQGERLVRPPRGFDAEHPAIEDLKRKSFYVMSTTDAKLARSSAVVDVAVGVFKAAAGLNRFITGALSLPFEDAA